MEKFKSMAEFVLKGKRILAVGDKPDILTLMEGKILGACPDCRLDRAATYQAAAKMMTAETYDVIILDIMGDRGLDLLDLAVRLNSQVAMFTGHDPDPNKLEIAFNKGARTYIPEENLEEIVPYLESILTNVYVQGRAYLLSKLIDFFESMFEPVWKKKTKLAVIDSPEMSR